MRLLFISPVIGEGFGQERVLRDSSRLLRAAGHSVYFIAGEGRGELPPNDGVREMPEVRRSLPFYDARRARREAKEVLAAVDAFRPDIVHFTDQMGAPLLRAIATRYPSVATAHLYSFCCPASTRMVATEGHYGDCEKRSGLACWFHHRQQQCLSAFRNDRVRAHVVWEYHLKWKAQLLLRRIIAISRHVEEKLLADGLPRQQICRIYNPVEVTAPLVDRPRGEVPHLLCATRLERHKGVEVLLTALAQIKDLSWELDIAGDGSDRSRLELLTANLGLGDRVRFAGRLPEKQMALLWKRATCLLQPNLGPEPFGLSVAEATAQGIPVIASRIPALDEVVGHEQTGLLFPPGDAGALRIQIERLLGDEALRTRLAAAGPRWIGERFSPERHLSDSLRVYTEVLNEAKAAKIPLPLGPALDSTNH